MFNDLNEVTYSAFGINPEEFYCGKFDKIPHHNYFEDPVNKFHLGSERIRFLCKKLHGGKVLDLGCGGGPYGMTLKKYGAADYLVGIDLDRHCLDLAGQVYDEVICWEALEMLPFEDNSFDAVISSDFFGHIEFKYKDALIAETARVLKKGGKCVHLIESGNWDYLNCNPNDPNDPVRQFVYVDGHVGVESTTMIRERFERCFENIVLQNAMLFPFFTVQGFINNRKIFDDGFADLLQKFTPEEAQAANVVTGYICNYLQDALLQENPQALDPTATKNLPQVLQYECGFVFLTGNKPQ